MDYGCPVRASAVGGAWRGVWRFGALLRNLVSGNLWITSLKVVAHARGLHCAIYACDHRRLSRRAKLGLVVDCDHKRPHPTRRLGFRTCPVIPSGPRPNTRRLWSMPAVASYSRS